jgi:hypothetical protein
MKYDEESRRRGISYIHKKRRAKWIRHILHSNSLLKHIIKGKIEGRIHMMERRGRRRKQLLVELQETRGYWKLVQEALDRNLWRTQLGRGNGPICDPVEIC